MIIMSDRWVCAGVREMWEMAQNKYFPLSILSRNTYVLSKVVRKIVGLVVLRSRVRFHEAFVDSWAVYGPTQWS